MSSSETGKASLTEAYPEVFNTIPHQPDVKKEGQLSEQQVKEYFEEGFVLVENFFDVDKELEPCREAIREIVDQFAKRLYAAGKIKELYEDYGLFERVTMLEQDFPGANVILHKLGFLPQAFRDLWSNERLLNIMEQLLGTSDIMGNPNWNIRVKTPQNEASTVPWHQDSGYGDNDSHSVMQVTAWMPLLDAGEKEGCLEMVRGGHKTGRIATHHGCVGDTWYLMLDEDEMEKTLDVDVKKDSVIVPVKYGSMLLFSNIIPHRSLNNLSDKIRWSLDLRWQATDTPSGFYGVKQGVRMRSSAGPLKKIEWDSFDAVNRHKAYEKSELEEDEFDTTIIGPWMTKWEITHHNRHTEALQKKMSQ